MAAPSGFVVWLTGPPAAGKSTIARRLAGAWVGRGLRAEVLDGDAVRAAFGGDLGFSREDRDTNVARVGDAAARLVRAGACVAVAMVSPYRAARDAQRARIARFCEVHCAAPIDVLARRDPKGLYRRALAGELRNLTGVDDPYEPPLAPEVTVHTDREPPDACAAAILAALEELGYSAAQHPWPTAPFAADRRSPPPTPASRRPRST
jgi:adenylyl-sulfate kinase